MVQEKSLPARNHIQHLYLELFRTVRYNLLNGERVVADLLNWRDLWYSAIATRLPMPVNHIDLENQSLVDPSQLALLRTTRWDQWPADTLYIWTNDKSVDILLRLISESWEASEIEVLLPDAIEMRFSELRRDAANRVLFIWWD